MDDKPMAVKTEDVILWHMVKLGIIGFGIGTLLVVILYDIVRAIF